MSSLDPHALRTAFGGFMTGVTVVTCKAADGTRVGFTANSFSSVSLDPPLLLVCPGKFLSSYDSFAKCTEFAVNILSEGQEDVASTFASFKGDRFACTPHTEDSLGNLLIDGALAQFSCSTHQIIEAGDHAILIGKVRGVSQGTGRGLGYVGGQFFSLGLERTALDHSCKTALCGAIITQGGNVLLEKAGAGYRLPHITTEERRNLRQTLETHLENAGQPVSLGPVFSVFDESTTHCSYYLATTETVSGKALEPHPIDGVANLKFVSKPVQDMMNRFALEAQTQSFGLYVGNAQHGDVHPSAERI